MVLLRGNNIGRTSGLFHMDIDGARPKKLRERKAPMNPLEPAYQPLEPAVLPVYRASSSSKSGPIRVPQTELAELWDEQGTLTMAGRPTRKDYRKTNDTSDIELAQPKQYSDDQRHFWRNGDGKLVTDPSRDGLAAWTPTLAADTVLRNTYRPPNKESPALAPTPTPETTSRQEQLAKQLLSSGFSASEAQRIMRRAAATGGRAAAAEAPPLVRKNIGKKTFTDTAYESHMETHLSMPGMRLVQRPVGKDPLTLADPHEFYAKSKLRKELEASRRKAEEERAHAAAAEEAKARATARLSSGAYAPHKDDVDEWKLYVGVSTNAALGRKVQSKAELMPPPPPASMPRSLSTTDIDGAFPRSYVRPGEPGGRRARRQYRETNWTLEDARGRSSLQFGERGVPGVGMWWATDRPVRQRPTNNEMFQNEKLP